MSSTTQLVSKTHLTLTQKAQHLHSILSKHLQTHFAFPLPPFSVILIKSLAVLELFNCMNSRARALPDSERAYQPFNTRQSSIKEKKVERHKDSPQQKQRQVIGAEAVCLLCYLLCPPALSIVALCNIFVL